MTQTDKVLAELRRRGEAGLTPIEALDDIGTFRLAARINDARKLIDATERIDTEMVTVVDHSGQSKTYARYVLRRRDDGLIQTSLW